MLNSRQRDAKETAKKYFLDGPIAAVAAMGGVGVSPPSSKNIIGLGVGAKITNGTILGQEAIRIYVRVKIPNKYLSPGLRAPQDFDGFPTDVVEVGDVSTLQSLKSWQRFNRNRPTSCGVSIGHPNITAGTLGCLVVKDSNHYILSNNHVLADSNNANRGDVIRQPGTADGGTSPSDDIAVLSDYSTIDFTGAANDIDAAIAMIVTNSQTDVEPEIIDIGRPKSTTAKAALYQSVRKHGRTTGHTVGVITDMSADIWVGYGSKKAWFEDQLAVTGAGCTDFSKGGDSGSLVVDAVSLQPVALLFAGAAHTLTYANPIDSVLNYFDVTIVG